AAGITGLHAALILRARASAYITAYIFFHADVLRHTLRDLFVVKLQLHAKIASPHAASAMVAASALSATKEVPENIITENISKLAEDIFHVHSASAVSAAPVAAYTRVAVAVVLCLFIRV